MRTFRPQKHILPPEQLALWSDLEPLRHLGFVLYGGTAIALRLGHRQSVDFDFFSSKILDKEAIRRALPVMRQSQPLQEEVNTLTVLAPGGVKISFFGGIGWGRFGHPELTDDSILAVASMEDLMATKLKAMLQRVEAKDYLDIATLIQSGTSLDKGLASAEKMFAPTFAVAPALKALTYFEGGDLSGLPTETRNILVEAVERIVDLPEVTPVSPFLNA